MIKLQLTQQEALDIFNLLGQLPTSSNAYQLYQKVGLQIKQQVEDPKVLEPAKDQDKDGTDETTEGVQEV